MSRSRVSELLAGKRALTADTATRLGAFFDVDAAAFLNLQAQHDLAQVAVPTGIEPMLWPAGFLIGPKGATPIPMATRPAGPLVLVPPADWAERMAREPARSPRRIEHDQVTYACGTHALVARVAEETS